MDNYRNPQDSRAQWGKYEAEWAGRKMRLTLPVFLFVVSSAAAEPIERSRIAVVDGDTVMIDGERVRLVGFDTPETGHDTARCDAEIDRGMQAADRLVELLDGGDLDIRYRKHRDRYGRLLALLKVNGKNVGAALIRERLAVRYKGYGPKMDWCPRSRQ